MKKVLITISAALLAATSFAGVADARPGKGKGHAYGHQKNHKAQRYVVQRRNNNAAIAAGVTGAILGGALATTARPAYRTYERPAYRAYEAPRRTYYREDYYDDYEY
ncbi:hypothetical protein VB618_03325 [Microvirga sp. CF3062]|uniref:hypothetical protein n=1 Tax=Microvirga sp. CF3062 TaxID=3110182 RepID=UPI002E76AE46|nr:hypothetical protein [Microvirga sp. CF3062]MEE1655215.1 hypothetical protein [Microvirga sp. CF3062]